MGVETGLADILLHNIKLDQNQLYLYSLRLANQKCTRFWRVTTWAIFGEGGASFELLFFICTTFKLQTLWDCPKMTSQFFMTFWPLLPPLHHFFTTHYCTSIFAQFLTPASALKLKEGDVIYGRPLGVEPDGLFTGSPPQLYVCSMLLATSCLYNEEISTSFHS